MKFELTHTPQSKLRGLPADVVKLSPDFPAERFIGSNVCDGRAPLFGRALLLYGVEQEVLAELASTDAARVSQAQRRIVVEPSEADGVLAISEPYFPSLIHQSDSVIGTVIDNEFRVQLDTEYDSPFFVEI